MKCISSFFNQKPPRSHPIALHLSWPLRRNNLSASCVCTRRCDPTVTPSRGRNVVSTVSTAVYLKRITGPWLGWSYPYPNTSLVFWVGSGGLVIPNLRRWHWMSLVCWVQIFLFLFVFEFEKLKNQHFNFFSGHGCYSSLPNIFYSSTFPFHLGLKFRM